MYVIKRQQLLPEGDPVLYRDKFGALHVFEDHAEAARVATDLQSDPHNKGWRFFVDTAPLALDPFEREKAEGRSFRA